MKKSALFAALSTLTAVAATTVSAATTVNFVKPENFVDMPFSKVEKQRVMDDLQAYIAKLGTKLPAGQDLKVDITDIDLAGREEPFYRGRPDMRVLRGGADWPMIELHYRIEAEGKVVKEGDSRLADLNYLRQFNGVRSTDSLRFEKRLLEDWFKEISP
jgi:hypothetical protein